MESLFRGCLQITFVMLKLGGIPTKSNKKYIHVLQFISSFEGVCYKKL